MSKLRKIISGGQTGVDQAALRAAQDCGLECGGWCPPGRICESGGIPLRYPLVETPVECSSDAPGAPRSLRTEWNVRDSDATLILEPRRGMEDRGTSWAKGCAEHYGRPLLVCDPDDPLTVVSIQQWLNEMEIEFLNVAGPSEASVPGIGDATYNLMVECFRTEVQDNLTMRRRR